MTYSRSFPSHTDLSFLESLPGFHQRERLALRACKYENRAYLGPSTLITVSETVFKESWNNTAIFTEKSKIAPSDLQSERKIGSGSL
jgi:hypothetical protein